jgi:ribosome-associated heat shock protein Hsp15
MRQDGVEQDDKIRLDKWLWAARFFKTRALAVDAITGGKVHVDGQRVKPSREARLGQKIEVRTGEVERTVIVRGLSSRRGPASEAALLYQETAESLAKREEYAARRREERHLFGERANGEGRPTKKDRRMIRRFVGE